MMTQSKSTSIRILKCIPITFLLLFLGAAGFAQTKNALQALLEKRKGFAAEAKPCRYDKNLRPCVLVTPDRLALVRRETLQQGSFRHQVYEKYTRKNADRWLSRPITIPETGGWPHDFFCVDGSMLTLPADQRFNPDSPSVCPVCGRKYLSDKVRGARHSFEHYWLCQAVRDLSLVYAIEGKIAYAQKAIEILTKYADAYPTQGIQRLTLLEAVNLIPLAEGYDLLYPAMTESERTHIQNDLLWPAAQALTKAGFGGNWGSWHLAAIGVIGYATRHQRFIDFATAQFKAQIADQLGSDGLWPESVSTYHFYPLDGFLAFAEAAANNGVDLYHWKTNGKGLQAMFEAPLSYAYPNMRLAAINDGWYEAYLPQDQYTMAYYRYRLPEFAWAIRQIRRGGKSGVPGDFLDPHYRDLLYGEPLPKKLASPDFASIDFPVLGIAVLRQGTDLPADQQMMMTFDYGPLLGHGQPDKMGITLFAKGKLLSADYGTTGYGSAADRFLRSTPAHNTLVVDGKDQPKTKDRDLVAFRLTPSFKLASARTREVASGSTWTRTVMLTDRFAVVWDHIEGSVPHQYDWFFHAAGKSLSVKRGEATALPAAGSAFTYKSLRDVRQVTVAEKNACATWDSPDRKGLRCWFMNDAPGQVVYTAQMPTAEKKQVPLLVLRQTGVNGDFVAVIGPSAGESERNPVDQVHFLRNTDGSTQVTLSTRGNTETIHLGSVGVAYQKNHGQRISVPLSEKP